MKLASSKKITDHFDQPQIDELGQALRRAWEVVQHMDVTGPPDEARKLLALCIMEEARSGEANQILLVNRAIVEFRLRQARIASQKRRA
jgi:hypothetical protein